MRLSKRTNNISPSPTLSITAKAKKMQAEGMNVISFGAGEPDFDTPQNIKNAAKMALDKGFTKYTPTSGITELKRAIAEKFKNDNGLDYSLDEIIVSCGAKHSIFNVVASLVDEGDEVIIPSPYWVSYAEMVKLFGGICKFIHTDESTNFKITSKQLKGAITPRTKLVILNSPSNPTGMVYDKDELKAIADVIVESDVYCISDEIYEKLIYDGKGHVSIASLGDEIKERTIVVNGVSKTYSMTGFRIGYLAGPKEIVSAMSNIQDHSTSNPASISQYAALEALRGPTEELDRMTAEFKKRRNYMVERINSIKYLSTIKPDGAFYCWINVKNLKGKKFDGNEIRDSLKLTELLLEDAKVAVVPGVAFGDDDYIRMSYATSMENIEEGLNRIEDFVDKLE
ncbi:MAG: pyridoxal phosphate-dependent aminotransferase [Candidatus Aenigmarchaeota archaeon]|nr:pyridoxal phosphate-dependent aminotransferase [Candidatus Aenigmarchaeota archaeon]